MVVFFRIVEWENFIRSIYISYISNSYVEIVECYLISEVPKASYPDSLLACVLNVEQR